MLSKKISFWNRSRSKPRFLQVKLEPKSFLPGAGAKKMSGAEAEEKCFGSATLVLTFYHFFCQGRIINNFFLVPGTELWQHGGCCGVCAGPLLLCPAPRSHPGGRERRPGQGPAHWALHQVRYRLDLRQFLGIRNDLCLIRLHDTAEFRILLNRKWIRHARACIRALK